MKKLATTFGLLALMLVVTSFTSPNETGGRVKDGRGTSAPGDYTSETGGRVKDGKGTSAPGDFTLRIDGKGTSAIGD